MVESEKNTEYDQKKARGQINFKENFNVHQYYNATTEIQANSSSVSKSC